MLAQGNNTLFVSCSSKSMRDLFFLLVNKLYNYFRNESFVLILWLLICEIKTCAVIQLGVESGGLFENITISSH